MDDQSRFNRGTDKDTIPQQYEGSPPLHPQLQGLEVAPISTTHQFSVRYESKMNDQVYEGLFTCKKLSVRDYGKMGVLRAKLNEGFHFNAENPAIGLDPETDAINAMIAHLQLALIQSPAWWNLDDLWDHGLAQYIYTKVMDFENSFFRSRRDRSNVGSVSSKGTGGSQSQETSNVGSLEEVGGKQVQASLEP